MSNHRFNHYALLVVGIIVILLGLMHFAWMPSLLTTGEFANLSGDYHDLVALMTLAVGVLLSATGALAVYFAQTWAVNERAARVYALVLAVVWLARALLEILFPVNLPLFFVPNPTILVLPGALVLAALFGLAAGYRPRLSTTVRESAK